MIQLDSALAAARTTLEEADGPLTIAVVDAAGAPVVVLRSDDARPFTADVALAKARTAAAFGNDTASLEELWSQRPVFAHSLIAQGDWFVGRGGVPVRDGEDVIGGVGVSGNEPAREVEWADQISERLNR